MQLFLMRHGEAEYHARSDRERELTDSGLTHSKMMSEWLKNSVSEFDLVLVSPYLRTMQTWETLSAYFPEPKRVKVLSELVPAADPDMSSRLVMAYAEQFKAQNVLVISHMPLLGYMVSELVPGIEPPLFATSSVALIDFMGKHTSLMWQQSPHSIG